MSDPDALRAWLGEHELASAEHRFSDEDLALAVAVRDALRSLIGANSGHPMDPAARALLNDVAGRADLTVRFDDDRSASMAVAADGIVGSLGRILATVHRTMATGTWERLRLCERDACRWAFYDTSRNRSRRWCSMEVCGNREKGAAFRRRRASGAAG